MFAIFFIKYLILQDITLKNILEKKYLLNIRNNYYDAQNTKKKEKKVTKKNEKNRITTKCIFFLKKILFYLKNYGIFFFECIFFF